MEHNITPDQAKSDTSARQITTLELDRDLWRKAKAQAALNGETATAFLQRALQRELEREPAEAA
jgi:hypothetical protein